MSDQQDFDYKTVSLFEVFSEESLARLHEIFTSEQAERGTLLIEAGKTVPAIFVLREGEVLVELEDRILAKIKKGGVFGEMSFLGQSVKASATIRVESQSISYLQCQREIFLREIDQNDRFSRDFYKGVSLLMSERLRQTNEKMRSELREGFAKIVDLIQELEENSKIDQTRDSLDKTGSHIVSKIRETIPKIRELESHHPEEYQQFEEVLANLEEIMIEDAQSFDRICQKIDQLRQYFSNLKTIVRGAGVFEIRGDKKLFDESSKPESTIEFL